MKYQGVNYGVPPVSFTFFDRSNVALDEALITQMSKTSELVPADPPACRGKFRGNLLIGQSALPND